MTKLDEAKRELEVCSSISEESKKLILDRLVVADAVQFLGLDNVKLTRDDDKHMSIFELKSGREIRIMDYEVK